MSFWWETAFCNPSHSVGQVPFLSLRNTCGQLLLPPLSEFAWSNLFMSLPLPPPPLDGNLLKWLFTLLSLYFRHPSKAGVCGWRGSVGISDLTQCTKLNCWIMNGWMKLLIHGSANLPTVPSPWLFMEQTLSRRCWQTLMCLKMEREDSWWVRGFYLLNMFWLQTLKQS